MIARALRRGSLAVAFCWLITASTALAASSGCDRPPLHGEFEPQACVLAGEDLAKFYDGCVKPQNLMAPENLMASLVRRAQFKYLFDRDGQLLSRISPTHPDYDKIWRAYDEDWSRAFGSKENEEVYRADFSYAVKPEKRGELERAILSARSRKTYYANQLRLSKGRGPLPLDTAYDLLKAGILLSAIHTPYTQKLKKEGQYAKYAALDIDLLEDHVYDAYPELKVDDEFRFQVQMIYWLYARDQEVAVVHKLFGGLKEGHPLELSVLLATLEQVIQQKIAPNANARKQLAELEHTFAHVMQGFRANMLETLTDGGKDSKSVYAQSSPILFALAELDPQAGDWFPSVLGSIYCQKTLGTKKGRERWESFEAWIGGTTALVTIGTLVVAVASRGRVENPEVLRAITQGILRGSFVVGTGLSISDYALKRAEYQRSIDGFYWGLTAQSELREAEDAKSKSAMVGALMLFSFGSGVVAARLQPLIASAQAVTLPGGIAFNAAAVGRVLGLSQLAVLGSFFWMDLKEKNWFGVAFQMVGMGLGFGAGDILGAPHGPAASAP